MSTLSNSKNWIQLSHHDDSDGYVITTKEGDRFALSFDEMVGACQLSENRKDFFAEFKEAFALLEVWLNQNASKLDRAYLSFGGDGLDFLVVQKSVALDQDLDESIIDLDIDIANNHHFKLLRLHPLLLPYSSEDSIRSFVRAAGTFKRLFD